MSDDLTAEDREARYIRAREVLQGAGWVFDEFVNHEMRKIMVSEPDDMTAREVAYTRARVATELKTRLMSEVKDFEDARTLAAHVEQMKEPHNGRRD